MGTSVSQRSSPTANWQAVGAAYTALSISEDRIAQEIWRAALVQPTGPITTLLGAPLLAECARIVTETASPQQALMAIRRHAALSGISTIAVDIAQRAAVGAFQQTGDRLAAFSERLFAETTNYLVSRDLSGYLGAGPRVATVSDLSVFKTTICNKVADVARAIPCPPEVIQTPQTWHDYVETVARTIAGGV